MIIRHPEVDNQRRVLGIVADEPGAELSDQVVAGEPGQLGRSEDAVFAARSRGRIRPGLPGPSGA